MKVDKTTGSDDSTGGPTKEGFGKTSITQAERIPKQKKSKDTRRETSKNTGNAQQRIGKKNTKQNNRRQKI